MYVAFMSMETCILGEGYSVIDDIVLSIIYIARYRTKQFKNVNIEEIFI